MSSRLDNSQAREAAGFSIKGGVAIAGLALLLAACSYVPNWANPVTWYDGVSGYIQEIGSDDGVEETAAVEEDEDEEAYPRLSAVPDRPAAPEDSEEVIEGLVADRENVRHTDEVLRADTSTSTRRTSDTALVETTPAPAPAPVAAPAPAPRRAETQVAAVDPAAPRPVQPRRRTRSGERTSLLTDDEINSRRTITSGRPGAAPRRAAPQPVPPVVPQSLVRQRTAPPPPPARVVVAEVAPQPALAPRAQLIQPAPRTQVAALAQPITMGTGTSALSDIYTKLLGDSARTVTTAPANAAFQGSSGMPIAQDTTAVPAIVRDTYNEALAATRRTTSTGLSAAGAAPAFAASSVHAVVKFANGSSVVQRRYNQTLKQIADQHKAQGGIIRVVGHASSRTQNLPVARHNIVNFRISVDRAQSVAKALMRLGVSHNAILIIAKSDAEPAFLEAMPKGEAENRRTEIFLDF